MARPAKDANERRGAQVKIRLTEAEHDFLSESAAAAGLTVSELVRRRALGVRVQPSPTRSEAALVSELHRIGVNVNQLARSVNRGRDLPDFWAEIGADLRKTLDTVLARYGS
jgi:hypothetical protein